MKPHPLLALARPRNMAIAAAGAALGALVSMPETSNPPAWTTLAGAAAMAALVAGGNADNDLLDLAADAVNRPDRPLPSGAVSPARARAVAAAGYLLAVAVALCVSLPHALLVAGLGTLLLLYNRLLKGVAVAGNVAVALLSASPLLWVSWPAPSRAQWGAALLGFFLTLPRELAKDLEDAEGDAKAGRRTLPVLLGTEAAGKQVFVLGCVVCALALAAPWICGWTEHAARACAGAAKAGFSFGGSSGVRCANVPARLAVYWISLALLFAPPMGASLIATREGNWTRARKMVKLAMAGGLAALFAGSLASLL